MAAMLVPAIVAAAVIGSPASAQEKQSVRQQKVLLDNQKVRVTESTWKPGEVNPMADQGYRITRVLQGGTMERTHGDGKKEKIEWKTGEVKEYQPSKSSTKNIGKTTVVVYNVTVK
jgi:hypothetical protein